MLYDEYISVEVLELCEPQSRRILPGLLRELHPSPAEPFAFTAHVVYGETDARLVGLEIARCLAKVDSGLSPWGADLDPMVAGIDSYGES